MLLSSAKRIRASAMRARTSSGAVPPKLVREATAKEVEAGSQRTIDPDESKAEGGEKKAPEPANKKAADPKTKDA